jgi:hypothetical protein
LEGVSVTDGKLSSMGQSCLSVARFEREDQSQPREITYNGALCRTFRSPLLFLEGEGGKKLRFVR